LDGVDRHYSLRLGLSVPALLVLLLVLLLLLFLIFTIKIVVLQYPSTVVSTVNFFPTVAKLWSGNRGKLIEGTNVEVGKESIRMW
jgi:hypothetical protein